LADLVVIASPVGLRHRDIICLHTGSRALRRALAGDPFLRHAAPQSWDSDPGSMDRIFKRPFLWPELYRSPCRVVNSQVV